MLRTRDVLLCILTVLLCGCFEQPANWQRQVPPAPVVSTPATVQGKTTRKDRDSQTELAELARGESDEADLLARNITADQLRQLPQLPRVNDFKIRHTVVTKEHLDAIVEKFPNIEKLWLPSLDVRPDVLASIPKLKSLKVLYISEDNFNDAALEPLRGLPLTELAITNIAVTDAGMEVVGTLVRLEKLYVHDLPLTDAGIRKLGALTKLKWLSLGHTEIADGSLKVIAGMHELTQLHMNGTPITDAGFAELVTLVNLETLDANCPGLTDQSLGVIAKLPKIQFLSLWGTQITDSGLEILGHVKSLRTLQVGQTKVTDAGLPHLYGLTLWGLDLSGTATTPEAIEKFKQAIPDVQAIKFGTPQ